MDAVCEDLQAQLKKLTVPWPESFCVHAPEGVGGLWLGFLLAGSPGTFTMTPDSVQNMKRARVACLREEKALDASRKQGFPQGLGFQTFHAKAYLSTEVKISHLVLAPSILSRQEPGIVESSKGQATYKV